MTGVVSVVIRGETLLLHPERAVLWPAAGTVIVADTHFGKSGVFGRHGRAVPAGPDETDRERLRRLVVGAAARRLLILGDFLHAPLDLGSREAADLERWCETLRPATIEVVTGNHDRGPQHAWRGPVEWVEHDCLEPPFRFTHDAAKSAHNQDLYVLSGHIHPVISLRGLRKRTARVPVFWQRQSGLILPSFGLFTGGFAIAPAPGERVFAVSAERVVAFPVR